jgi:hypothetical protein
MAAALIGLLAGVVAAAQGAALRDRVPLDAIATIVEAFRTHPIVAIDEEHGDERSHAFRVSLVRDARFPPDVNDIVVEFGNSRFQNLADRFVMGEPVSADELKRIWQDTTQAHAIWDRPIYEDFLRTVRSVNAALPRERRRRVLLGDPPVDWRAITTREELNRARGDRSKHPADVIVREVLDKGRRALVIYGALHLMRQNPQGANLIEHVERDGRVKAFVVVAHPLASLHALGLDPATWPAPRIALTRGSSLENQVDAVLYLGAGSGRPSRLTASLCADATYREMRTARMALAGLSDAVPRLAKECSEAQARPDFSGQWMPLEDSGPLPAPPSPKTGGPPPPPPPRTLSVTISMSALEMKIERRVDGGREAVLTSTYKLDGTESVNQSGAVVSRTTAAWDGNSLVLSSVLIVADKPLGKSTETYRLENGDLVVDTSRAVPAGTFTSRTIHKKSK